MKIQSSFYKNNHSRFSTQKFLSPDLEFAPIYSWVWNDQLSYDEISKQIDEMWEMDIKAFYVIPLPKHFRPTRIPTDLEPEYLSDEYMQYYRFTIEQAQKRGMQVWLYDEGGWPSGGACGKVLKENPHLAKRTLEKRTVVLEGGKAYALGENALAAFYGEKRVEVGQVFDETVELIEYYSCIRYFQTPNTPDFPDLLLKESADKFIESTHDKYKQSIHQFFGNTMTAVFTDEPVGPGIVPAFVGFEKMFEDKYGYSIVPYFPVLKGVVEPSESDWQALIDFYDMCSALYCENFMFTCKKWSNENGLAFTGHVDKDDELLGSYRGGYNYNILRALRCLDIPGVDVIWRQIFPRPFAYATQCPFFPRLASSATVQNGGGKCMTESFAVYGPCLTYDEMRYVVGAQAVRGINVYNPMLISYGRRDHYMAGEMPNFSKEISYFADVAYINEYMSRLAYITSLGVQKNEVALYTPTSDYVIPTLKESAALSYNECGKALESKGVAFDIFDDDVLENADETALANGKICVGLAEYTTIVLPNSKAMRKSAQNKIDTFVKGGGKVFTAETLDMLTVQYPLKAENTLFAKRVLENGERWLAFNKGQGQVRVEVEKTGKNAYLINLTDGKIFALEDVNFAFTLRCGETMAVWVTDEKITTQTAVQTGAEMPLNGFTLQRKNRFIIGKKTFETQSYNEQPTPVELGDWKAYVGEEFSGDCVYETTFTMPKNAKQAVLDLGKVMHTAKVLVNGKNVGVKVMPPYQFILPTDVLAQENRLQICVSNTAANEYVHTRSFEKMETYKLTAYFEKEMEFCKDTVEQGSGLFGPVKILY